jgi:hypothetical protein
MERTPQAVRLLGNVRILTFGDGAAPARIIRAPGAGGRLVSAALLALLVSAPHALAQPAAERVSISPPDALAPPLASVLTSDAVRVSLDAGTVLDFWWVSALPTAGGEPVAWSQVDEGALVGALRVAGRFRDIRGKTVKPGVYTLRFGLQPQNGDHLGSSPFREYLLISPAAADVDPSPLGFDGTVAISKQTIGTSHPASLSLDPPVTSEPVLSRHTNELDHQGIVFAVKTASGGTLAFGLILVGVIEH